jgi:hypothetical protein
MNQMNRNNFAFYTEFGINKTLDLINVSDSNSILNIFLLLSLATNQTSQITRYSAVYIYIYLFKLNFKLYKLNYN